MFRKLLNSELNRITPEEFKLRKKMPVIVVLDNIRSQHNIGSAFRSCDAFLVEKLLLCGICAVPPTPEIHKSALGAEFSMEWEHFESTAEAVRRLKEEGYVIVSVEQTEHSTLLQDLRPAEGARYAFIFGNEVRGVQQEVVNMSNICLEIPQYGTKHSLNVSVSIGVVLWDVVSKFF